MSGGNIFSRKRHPAGIRKRRGNSSEIECGRHRGQIRYKIATKVIPVAADMQRKREWAARRAGTDSWSESLYAGGSVTVL